MASEERILYVTPGYRLVALDATTGDPVKGFGENGIVDLKQNDDQDIDLVHGDIGLHATPLVARNTVIVGAAHLAGNVPKTRNNVKGYVRGFDVRTGRRKWIFHTIPRKGEFGYDTWMHPGEAEHTGNTGCWAQMSADQELGLAYLPVEMPTGDYQWQVPRRHRPVRRKHRGGGHARPASAAGTTRPSITGCGTATFPARRSFATSRHDGKIVKALAQPTKQAFLYVLNRETGEPIWPIPEMPVEAGDVPGEWYSPDPAHSHQAAAAMTSQGVIAEHLIDFTPELHRQGLAILFALQDRRRSITPPTLATLDGRWGTLGRRHDQWRHQLARRLLRSGDAHRFTSIPRPRSRAMGIVPVTDPRVSDFEYARGLPGTTLRGADVREPRWQERAGGLSAPAMLTVQGLPLLKPPYGRITAIDLTKGEIAWQVAHGETPDNIKNHPALKGLNIPRTGRPGMLGPLVTKSLVICGESGFFTTPSGARGAMLRAYDKATGEEKGAVYMPAPQTGSPMTYMLEGRQYIVLAIGGGSYTAELAGLPPAAAKLRKRASCVTAQGDGHHCRNLSGFHRFRLRTGNLAGELSPASDEEFHENIYEDGACGDRFVRRGPCRDGAGCGAAWWFLLSGRRRRHGL